MSDQDENDQSSVVLNVEAKVEANTNAVVMLGLCATACFGILTFGTVRLAAQPDGTNKLRAVFPWGRKALPHATAPTVQPAVAVREIEPTVDDV